MDRPFVIAINSVSGGGKTALARLVQFSLPRSGLFCFDEFDATNVYPENFIEWSRRGADLLEFDCPGMGEAVAREIERGSTQYLVLDYPFGRDHPRFRHVIDLSVFVDTPLDVAMARRIIRDYASETSAPPGNVLRHLRDEMTHYLESARPLYVDVERHRANSDLILNGCRSLEDLKTEVVDRARRERRSVSG